MRRWQLTRLVVAFFVVLWTLGSAPVATAFGTIDTGGQHREHERITRASLSCAGNAELGENCFAAKSMDFLAGHDREFGAVGAPDSDEIADPRAHCDNADFLDGEYPRTLESATEGLVDCVNHLRARFGEAVVAAGALLDTEGRIVSGEVDLDAECSVFDAAERRAKCATLESFGRALHGAQDFYAHSNWVDEADPARAVGDDNPPGLNLLGPTPALDLRSTDPPVIPSGLSTGCFVLRDEVPGVGECTERVTHAALNKDNGLVDPNSGETSGPTTPRGMVQDNFDKAVQGAITETRRQWQDFQSELADHYGEKKAVLMTCSLSHDNPLTDCGQPDYNRLVVTAFVVLVVLLSVGMLVFRRRRRRSVV